MGLNKRLISSEAAGAALFDLVTYTGNGTSQTFTTNIAPDLVITKSRSFVEKTNVFDSVRGATKRMYLNNDFSESATANSLTSFNSDGWSIGSWTDMNTNGATFVGWAWQAGGAASDNTNGDMTSQVSANVNNGFSIVRYTKVSGQTTVGHGLSQKPDIIFTKRYNGSSNWLVFTDVTGTHGYLTTTSTAGLTAYASSPNSTTFNSYYDTGWEIINYCFHSVSGVSKIGSYTGNGNASFGTSAVAQSITTGFEPRFVLIKITSTTDHWILFDSERKNTSTTYSQYQSLYPNLTTIEQSASSGGGYWHMVDFTSTGFDLGQDPSLMVNKNGATYIYMAFA